MHSSMKAPMTSFKVSVYSTVICLFVYFHVTSQVKKLNWFLSMAPLRKPVPCLSIPSLSLHSISQPVPPDAV